MKLELGKKYITRSGEVAGPMVKSEGEGADFFAPGIGLYFSSGIFGYGEYTRCESFDIVSEYRDNNETSASDTSSADAFARIISRLNDAVNAMLALDDFDKAIECAIMMRECERMRDDLDGDTGDNIADAVRRCVEDGGL